MAWLDKSSVQKILRNSENDESIEVLDITVTPATAKGDNYGSNMLRVVVQLSRIQDDHPIEETKSLIVKAMLQHDKAGEKHMTSGFFESELCMMSVTLPRMNEILKDVSPTSLFPRCLHIQHNELPYILMEDLAPRGFKMADRHAGLDLDHCLLTVRNLGKFHAASVALIEKDPMVFTKHTKGLLHKDQLFEIVQFYKLGAKYFAEEVVNWPEVDRRIAGKLPKVCEILFEKACEVTSFREDDFNVLNHGDFWVNNVLFRYDEQRKPVEQKFVDFQVCHYGSPAVDIFYFLGISVENEIRLNHRDLLFHEYHASLSRTMVKLKCQTAAPNFENFKEALKRRAFVEVFATITLLPLTVYERKEEIDFEKLATGYENYENPSYRGKSYRKLMTSLLPLYDSMGLLDV